MAKRIAAEVRAPRRARIVSQFQQDIKTFKTDPLVNSLVKARKQIFNAGDDGIEAVTRLLKKRIVELKEKATP